MTLYYQNVVVYCNTSHMTSHIFTSRDGRTINLTKPRQDHKFGTKKQNKETKKNWAAQEKFNTSLISIE